MHQTNQNKYKHVPVLTKEVLKYLDPKQGESYLDLTAGYGGHADLVLGKTGSPAQAVLVDRDKEAVDFLKEQFVGQAITVTQADFLSASQLLKESGKQFDLILADLGVSSPHLDKASRGFAIQTEGPLDMRMDSSQKLTAAEIVNTYSEADLSELIWRYGEEPKARKIAQHIVVNRPVSTTTELASIIARTVRKPGSYKKTHPATQTFQALRIAVNDELRLLTEALPIWVDLLNQDGRLAVISFHSLEDRIVKQFFKDQAGGGYDARIRLLTKKPATAGHDEIVSNPRSRSAKLRAVVKINT